MLVDARACETCGARLARGSRLGDLCPRCLAELALPLASRDADEAGMRLGPYRLMQQLGEGGMGVVWLAEQEHPIRRSVALKVVKPGTGSDQVLIRFEAERQALAILNHPHIAKVFDAGATDDGRPYFVMEHVAGHPITFFADERMLPVAERLTLFLQVCEAVQHAHQKGVVHRDLKPTNILVGDEDGRPVVKIIDFGIAKALGPPLHEESLATQIGVFVGTPEYMSPEQAGSIDAAVDTRTDIYSLGLVLYELLVGSLPHSATELRRKAIFEMLRVIREDDPPRLTNRLTLHGPEAAAIARRRRTDVRMLLRQLRGDLEWITGRAIEKNPARRYPSVSDLAGDVRRHLAHEPVLAGPPDLRYRLGKLARKHRAATAAAAIAVAAVVLGAVLATMFWINAERARRDTRSALKTLQLTTGLELANQDEGLKALPWLVAALELEDGGQQAEERHRIRLQQVLDGSPLPVAVWAHDHMIGATLASDRRLLATWDEDGTVKTWEPRRGTPFGPSFNAGRELVHLYVANASTVVTADGSGHARVWDPNKGVERQPAVLHGAGLRLVRLSNDGTMLLTADRTGGVRIWSVAGNDTSRLVASLQHDVGVAQAEFVGGGGMVAFAGETGPVIVAETATGRVLHRLAHERAVGLTALGTDRLLTLDGPGRVQSWSLASGTQLTPPTNLIPNGVNRVRAAGDGSLAVLCGSDGAAFVMPTTSRQPTRLDLNRSCVDVDLSSLGFAAVGHEDGSLRIWRPGAIAFTSRLPHQAAVVLVRFLEDDRYVLTADRDGVMRVWDLAPAAPPARIFNYTWTSTFSPDGRRLALASGTSGEPYAGFGSLIDPSTFEILAPPLRHGHNVRGIAFSPDGRLIATAAQDGTARIWRVDSGEPASPPIPHPHPLHGVVFSADGSRIATFGIGSDVRSVPAMLWEVPSGRLIAAVGGDGHTRPGGFSPDGRHIATHGDDGRVQVWRSDDGAAVAGADWSPYVASAFLSDSEVVLIRQRSVEVRRLDGALVAARDVTIDSSGDLVVDGARRTVAMPTANAMHVWRMTTAPEPRFVPLPFPGLFRAAFSTDGRWLLGVSGLRRAQVWSAETGEPVGPQRPLAPSLPSSPSFSPDGTRFQVGGTDAVVWDLVPVKQSVATLKKATSLLAAHELSGSQLTPLAASRIVELSQDADVAAALEPASASRWQWLVAGRYINERKWQEADVVTAAMSKERSARWEVWAARGRVLAELGRWQEAEGAFTAALARRPDWTELWFYRAFARYAGGDGDAIRAGCAAAWKSFGTTTNPDRAHWLARLCVHGGVDAAPPAAAVTRLAALASDVEPDSDAFGIVSAGALLREGRYDAALTATRQLTERSRNLGAWPEASLLMALAEARLAKRAGSLPSSLPTTGAVAPPLQWYRRIEIDRWLAESARR